MVVGQRRLLGRQLVVVDHQVRARPRRDLGAGVRDVQQHGTSAVTWEHPPILPECDRPDVRLTASAPGAGVEDVTVRVPLVTRPHIDLGRVWSAACPGS
ncbi:hypothetical protein GCM10009610_16560 [Pseudonocardia xinjiangensis]